MAMNRVSVPFGEWRPDLALTNNQYVGIAENVLPAPNSYLPFQSLGAYTNVALPLPCNGLCYAISKTGTFEIFAGTRNKLYKWGGTAWNDVTYGGVGGGYGMAGTDKWSFAQFGDWLVAVAPGLLPQRINIDTGTAFDILPGGPPQARYVKTVGDFLVLGCLDGHPNQIQWSALNDITGWTIGLNLCDMQEFPDGGHVRGITGTETGLIVQEQSVRAMQFLPGDLNTIFNFSRIEREKGCMAKYGCGFTNGALFFLAEEGFYALANGGLQPIGNHVVNDWFRANSDPSRRDQTLCIIAPDNPHVLWAFYSAASPDFYDRLLIFDWNLNKWTYATQAAQMWAPAGLPLFGVSLDGPSTGEFGDDVLDSNAPSLDAYYGGGRPVLAGFDRFGRLAFQNGPNLAARLETAETHFTPGARTLVSAVYPLIDLTSDERMTVAIGGREQMQFNPTFGSAEYVSQQGEAYVYSSSRLHRFRVSIPEFGVWTHAQGVQVEVQPDGER